MSSDWCITFRVCASRTGVLAAALALLAACGTNPQDRTEGGAATGAATGAAIGAIAGPFGIVGGAVVGGGAGALTGAAVGPGLINLGTPPWSGSN